MSARIPVETVQQLESLIGGDPIMEQWVLDFIQAKYQARNLLFLTEKVAEEILKRPEAFKKAARENHLMESLKA